MPQRLPRNPLDLRIHSLHDHVESGPPVPVPLLYTAPFFTRARILSIDWRVSLGAGGNKYPTVEILIDGVALLVAYGSLPMTAAGNQFISCSVQNDDTFYDAANGLYKFQLPPDIYLDSQQQLRMSVDGLVGGDTIATVKLITHEWITPRV